MRLSIRFLLIFASFCLNFCAVFVAHAAEGVLEWHDEAQPVPPLVFVNEAGQKQRFHVENKPVMLHFWATWCPPCIKELPAMIKELEPYGDTITLAVVSTDREAEKITSFYAENGLDLPVMQDEMSTSFRALKLKGLPSTVILNAEGEEIARRGGEVNWADPALHEKWKTLIAGE